MDGMDGMVGRDGCWVVVCVWGDRVVCFHFPVIHSYVESAYCSKDTLMSMSAPSQAVSCIWEPNVCIELVMDKDPGNSNGLGLSMNTRRPTPQQCAWPCAGRKKHTRRGSRPLPKTSACFLLQPSRQRWQAQNGIQFVRNFPL